MTASSLPTVYGIKNCDTVKRARAWLAAHAVDYTFHDFKSSGVTDDKLRQWSAAPGWQTLLNRKGTTWRQLSEATKTSVVDVESAVAVMRANPSAIKRPVVEWNGGGMTVGFDENAFLRFVK